MADDTQGESKTTAEGGPGGEPGSIGPYRILKELGRGGQGVVYLAEHEGRGTKVALKVLDGLGAQHAGTMARFRREALAASAIKHPGICGVVEADVASRVPFIAMEYVEGETLARRIAAQRDPEPSSSWGVELVDGASIAGTSTPTSSLDRQAILAALALVEKAARAVHAAHEAGVIHRDLKPANIMISREGEPVILDFGLARHEESDLETLTRTGDLIGTPAYMSPEQLSRKLISVDRRSDVWSLGVCLYEAVTLQRPFEAPTREGLYQAIITKEPLPASKVNPAVSPDLDVVLQTALDKDRDRRYQTALDFAEDLKNVRQREPILARPAGAWTKVARWARRNPAVAALIAAVFLALTGGLAVTTLLLARVAEAKTLADASAANERDAKVEADRKRQQAETNLDFAKRGNAILASVFIGLDPNQDYRTVAELRAALRENLDDALRDLEAGAVGEPKDVAALQLTLGRSLLGLGSADQAVVVLEKVVATHESCLGPSHRQTILGLTALGVCYVAAGRNKEGIDLQEDALERAQAALDPADSLITECFGNLGLAYRAAGRHREALEQFETMAARSRDANVSEDLQTVNYLASGYQAVGRPERSAELLEVLLPKLQAVRGPDHPKTIECMNNLATTRYGLGKPDPELLEDALARAKAQLGPEHPNTLMTVNNLADAYRVMGRVDEAITLFEENYPRARRALGLGDATVTSFIINLSTAYRAANRMEKAISFLDEVVEARKAGLGADHEATLMTMNALGSALQAAGQIERALQVLDAAASGMRKVLGADHDVTITTINNLAGACSRSKDFERALVLTDEAILGLERLGFRHPNGPRIMSNAIGLFEGLAKFEKAESWRRKWLAFLKDGSGAGSPEIATQLAGLGRNLTYQRKYKESQELLEESLEIRARIGSDTWETPSAQMLLGLSLLGQGQPYKAQPLLSAAYEGLKIHQDSIPQIYKIDIRQSVDLLIEAYMRMHKPIHAAMYRWERDKL